MRTQLLATFTTKKDIDDTIKSITSAYEIVFDKVYVLQNEDDVNELICTYNIDSNKTVDFNDVKGTISLHRKKQTNTLYTINALNCIIKDLNMVLVPAGDFWKRGKPYWQCTIFPNI